MGVALSVTADNAALVEAVARTCRGWQGVRAGDGPHLRLELELGPVEAASWPEILTLGSCLWLRGGVEAQADATAGRAWCRVPSAAVFDDGLFREQVLDSLILWLATRNGRTPLHASAFLADGVAVLLAGPSGSGKSCLARAADRAGLPLLTDDTVYVETGRRFRVWGAPRPIHLYPDDAPEAADAPMRLRNGKRKRAVQPSSFAPGAEAAVLCVLARGDKLALDPIGQTEALGGLGPPDAGFDLLADDIDRTLRRVTQNGAWRLTLNTDPDAAIALLRDNLPRLAERAAS